MALDLSKAAAFQAIRAKEKARFEADQSRLLQARVTDLEAELESVRASAKKDRDFQKQRIAALVARVDALEGPRAI